MIAQDAYTRKQYAAKHFSHAKRSGYLSALMLGHGVRAVAARRGPDATQKRAAARVAIRTLLGREQPPFGQPPATAFPAPSDEQPAQVDLLRAA